MAYHHLLDPARTPVLCFAARKAVEAPMVNPTQGFYANRPSEDVPLTIPPSPPGTGGPNGALGLERARKRLHEWRAKRIRHWDRLGRI